MSWRITGISVGWAVLVSSIGLGTYVLYFEKFSALFVCILCVNIVSCASWLIGATKRKKSLMIPSLVLWGILLSGWIFYVMLMAGTSRMNDHRDDSIIASLTLLAVLTIFYVASFIFAIVIYISMKSAKNRNSIKSHNPPYGETYTAIDEKDAFKA